MREGWEIKKLIEVCENLDSKRVPITQNKRVSGNIPYYGASGIVDYVKDFLFDEDLLLISEDGANLLARTYPIAFSITGKTWVNNHAHVLRFEEMITQRFVQYFFNSIRLDDFVSGMAQPKLNQKSLNSIPIPIPPLPEQQQIVAILDQAFEAIDQAKANIERNIENAKELFQSKLNQIFSQKGEGWKIEYFGDIFNFRQGIQRGVKLQSETKKEGQVRFVRIVDYTQGNELPRYIDNPGEQYILNERDISLVRYGASTGFVCRGIKGALANNLFRVIPKDNWHIDSNYLFYFLNSPIFQGYIKSKMSGAAMPAISFGMISKIPFPITSIENQIDISRKISEVEEQTNNILDIYKEKLTNLEELKKSILQKAFAGELTNKTVEV